MEVCGGVSSERGEGLAAAWGAGVWLVVLLGINNVYSPLLIPIQEHVNLAWTIIKQINSYFKGNAKHINQYKIQYSFNTPDLTTPSFNTKPPTHKEQKSIIVIK